MRKPNDTDFSIELPEVGTFRFGRRTFGDRPAIKAAYLKFVEQNNAQDWQGRLYEFLAGIDADPPDGWLDVPSELKAELYRRVGLADGTDRELEIYGNVLATYAVLCVSCPKGWEDLSKLDIAGNDNEDHVFKLHNLLRKKEDSFRPVANTGGEAPGAGTQPDDGLLVPQDLPTDPQRPALPGTDA